MAHHDDTTRHEQANSGPPTVAPGTSRRSGRDARGAAFTRDELTPAFFQPLLADSLGRPDLTVKDVALLHHDESLGLGSRLARTAQHPFVGLAPVLITLDGGEDAEQIRAMVKAKGHGDDAVRTVDRLAFACSNRLGEAGTRVDAFARTRHNHQRELGIYRCADGGLREVMPRVYGIHEDCDRGAYLVVMEWLGDQVVLKDAVDEVGDWRPPHIAAAVTGIARAHAVWLGRERELQAQPWLGVTFDARGMADRSDFWFASAEHVARAFPRLVSARWLRRAAGVIEAIPEWWSELEQMPRTLIHGDFTPRNIALRKDGLRLVAYDWECATLQIPQRDLADLLAHVLRPDVDAATVDHYVELHRRALQGASGTELCPRRWRRGYQLALADFSLTRLPLFLLFHQLNAHPFVERVATTTMRLVEIESDFMAGRRGSGASTHDRKAA